ncbi:aggrecan core protein [Elysia marginata]|uniref:Aggrecan core protein n=1 Tax=Elysia marginata TaxID=1093978 RepID=A0AAV4G315_9GAST|nr:aggrecan core protein [Elysia marginata]
MNQFIYNKFTLHPNKHYWIGLHDISTEGKFKWLDEKEQAQFTDWGPGQPDDYQVGEDCAAVVYKEHKYNRRWWNDASCRQQNNFICEKKTGKKSVLR